MYFRRTEHIALSSRLYFIMHMGRARNWVGENRNRKKAGVERNLDIFTVGYKIRKNITTAAGSKTSINRDLVFDLIYLQKHLYHR